MDVVDVLLIIGILMLICNISLKSRQHVISLYDSVDGLSVVSSDISNIYVNAPIKHKL